MNALAYTVGNDIFFAADHYIPHTPEGLRLIAHELAHTVQQQTGWQGQTSSEGVRGAPTVIQRAAASGSATSPTPAKKYNASLDVRVMSSCGGPIVGAVVKISPLTGNIGVNTDANGVASFFIDGGDYVMTVTNPGCRIGTQNITVVANKSNSRQVTLNCTCERLRNS